MKPHVARRILRGLSVAYLSLYLFVLFVAWVTSGNELVQMPGAWYAAGAPVLYVGLAGAYAFGLIHRPLPKGIVVLLHILVVPALAFSFMGLGLLLPIFATLWWFMTGQQPVAEHNRLT